MDRSDKQTILYTNKSRSCISVYRDLFRSRIKQPDDYPKDNRGRKYNNYNKYLLPVVLSLSSIISSIPAKAEVGGVSATAAPVANSSGSVTNQAIQVLQGPYITNTYGGGIQCQGPTMNFTPYVTGAVSAQKPFEDQYFDNVYDMRDMTGDFDDEGNEIEDGAPDNPGDILYQVPVRTGQKDNYNLSVGFSITWSTPLDKTLQDQCKQAAAANIDLMRQAAANKRLDFEIARLKNCGQLIKEGINFHPRSPYYKICADVVVQNVNYIKPHVHTIPKPTRTSRKAEDLGGLIE